MSPKRIDDEIAKRNVSRQMKYTLRRVFKGFCAYGGCQEKSQTFYCQKHRKAITEYQKDRYRRKRLTSGTE